MWSSAWAVTPVTAAFWQPKYHPNVISGKAYRIGKYLFIPTGLTFGDCSSPPSWEPFAAARMALSSTELSKGEKLVPEYKDYLKDVAFASPPPPGETIFAKAWPNGYNPAVMIMADGLYSAAPHFQCTLMTASLQQQVNDGCAISCVAASMAWSV